MSKILNRLYVSGGLGNPNTLSINSSTASSAVVNIVAPTASQDIFKIRTQSYNLTFSNVDIISTLVASVSSYGIVSDSSNNLYYTTLTTHYIKKIDTNGNTSIIAGNGSAGFSGDNGLASSSQLNSPTDIVFDSASNIFFLDQGGTRIRRISATSGIITTFAGGGVDFTSENIGATAVQIDTSYGIAFDLSGNLYYSDYGYIYPTTGHRVRKIDKDTLKVTTVVGLGSPGFSGDNGPATASQLNTPTGILFDSKNNLYINDYSNNRIRKVSATSSIITTIAGNGSYAYNGDSKMATDTSFLCLFPAIDKFDNIYIPDFNNNVLRKLNKNSVIKIICGSSSSGSPSAGDGLSSNSTNVVLKPYYLAFDNLGNLFISDINNQNIRKITLSNLNAANYSTALNPATEKVNNLFSVDGNGVAKFNGTLTFKDINFLTQSYTNASGNTNNFILQDGSKISSPYFKGTEFSASGSAFWMEPGYSRTWNAYSMLGDITKLNFSASFVTDSLVSFILSPSSSYAGLTYSDLFNISLFNNNNQPIYLPIIKTYSSSGNLNVSIDTFDANITDLSAILLGRNINYPSTYSTSLSNTTPVSFYAYNQTAVTYSLQFTNYYYNTIQSFTLSPYKINKVITKNAKIFNTNTSFYNNNPVALYHTLYNTTIGNYGNTSSGVAYTFRQNALIQSATSSNYTGTNINFASGANADANMLYIISNSGYTGTPGFGYIIRHHVVNATNVTQSLIVKTNYLPTQSVTINASSSMFLGYGFSDAPVDSFYIANTSSIGSTFSLKEYYTKTNFSSVTVNYNPSTTFSAGVSANVTSVTSISGSQSSIIFYLNRGTTLTLTQPLAVDY